MIYSTDLHNNVSNFTTLIKFETCKYFWGYLEKAYYAFPCSPSSIYLR